MPFTKIPECQFTWFYRWTAHDSRNSRNGQTNWGYGFCWRIENHAYFKRDIKL